MENLNNSLLNSNINENLEFNLNYNDSFSNKENEIFNNENNKLLKLHQFSSEEIDFYKIQVDLMMLNEIENKKFQNILQSQKNEEEKLKSNHLLSLEIYNQLSETISEKSNHQILLDSLNSEMMDLKYLKQLKKLYKKYTLEIKNFIDSQNIINQN